MFDFSGSEFALVVVVAILAIGPKQLPEVLHGLGKLFRRLQYMRFAVSRQFDDFMEQAELNELRNPKIIAKDFFDEAADDDEHHMKPLPEATQKSLSEQEKPPE